MQLEARSSVPGVALQSRHDVDLREPEKLGKPMARAEKNGPITSTTFGPDLQQQMASITRSLCIAM